MMNATCQRDILSLAYFYLWQLFSRSSNPPQLHYGDQSSGKAQNQLGPWPGPEPSGLKRYRRRYQQSMMLPLRFHVCFPVDSGRFGLCTRTTHWTLKPCKHLLCLSSVSSARHDYTLEHDHTSLRINVSDFIPEYILSDAIMILE